MAVKNSINGKRGKYVSCKKRGKTSNFVKSAENRRPLKAAGNHLAGEKAVKRKIAEGCGKACYRYRAITFFYSQQTQAAKRTIELEYETKIYIRPQEWKT